MLRDEDCFNVVKFSFDRECRLSPLFVCTVEDTIVEIVRWKNVPPSEIFTPEKKRQNKKEEKCQKKKEKNRKEVERHIAKAARKRGRKKNSEKNSTSENSERKG